MPTNICHEAFTVTEFNTSLLGRQLRQGVKILHFRGTVPGTLENFYTLTQVTAQQDFVLQIHLRSVIWQWNVLSLSLSLWNTQLWLLRKTVSTSFWMTATETWWNGRWEAESLEPKRSSPITEQKQRNINTQPETQAVNNSLLRTYCLCHFGE
jgi:hypothetical protein